MKISRPSASSDSSAKISIGYSSNRSDMAVSIKYEHCRRFGPRLAAWAA
ncbi:murein transglycosylase, partial [Burkholderia gladioli]